MLFPTGYQANIGALTTLVGKNDAVVRFLVGAGGGAR